MIRAMEWLHGIHQQPNRTTLLPNRTKNTTYLSKPTNLAYVAIGSLSTICDFAIHQFSSDVQS
jgi:hypothetical protein